MEVPTFPSDFKSKFPLNSLNNWVSAPQNPALQSPSWKQPGAFISNFVTADQAVFRLPSYPTPFLPDPVVASTDAEIQRRCLASLMLPPLLRAMQDAGR
mmetsp:Transcript_15531/g.42146  ORF Transcript_15531/g.42146 Transcript_15531/m.42146 type:complete len:99 (-) Transcript_15531:664-960(-)